MRVSHYNFCKKDTDTRWRQCASSEHQRLSSPYRRQRDHKGMNLAVTEDDASVPPAGLALTFNTYTAMSSTAGLDIN